MASKNKKKKRNLKIYLFQILFTVVIFTRSIWAEFLELD
jgi:hypothetical protein